MSTIQFENGKKVKFDGTPTKQDIEDVASKMQSQTRTSQEPKTTEQGTPRSSDGFLETLAKGLARPVATMAARPYQLGKALTGATEEEQAVELPFGLGTAEAPTSAKDVVSDVGRGLQTVSLGVGGAAPSVGRGMLGKTALGRATQALGGKIATAPGAIPLAQRSTLGRIPTGRLIKEGVGIGAKGGGMFGVGMGLEEEGTLGAAVSEGALGTVFGGVTGGLIPVGLRGIGGAFRKATGRGARTAEQRALLEAGTPETSIATKKLEDGRLVPDIEAKAAIDQGIPEADIASIKTSSESDKRAMAKMIDIKKKSLTNKDFARFNRSTDVPGEIALNRVKKIQAKNREFGQKLDQSAQKLAGKKVDITEPIDQFVEQLQIAGVRFNKNGNLAKDAFVDSIFDYPGAASTQRTIREMWGRMRRLAKSGDALQAHRIKKAIDETVDYGKRVEGLAGKAQTILKSFRHNIGKRLSSEFDNYAQLNSRYRETRKFLDELGQAMGKKFKIEEEFADAQLGKQLRRIFSNARSREEHLRLLNNLDTLSEKYNIPKEANIGKLAGFADTLEGIKTEAPTSFQGGIERAVGGVRDAEGVVGGFEQGGLVGGLVRTGRIALEKAKGINIESKINALEDLVKTKPKTNFGRTPTGISPAPATTLGKKKVGDISDDLTQQIHKAQAEGKSFDEFVRAKANKFHGTYDKKFKLKDEPIFLTDDFDEANTYAGYTYRTEAEGIVEPFFAKEGKTLDLNNQETTRKVFAEVVGSKELKKIWGDVPEQYQFIREGVYGDSVETLYPKTRGADFEDWILLEYQSKPKIVDGLKVRTGSYSFEKSTQDVRTKLYDAFRAYGNPTRQDVYANWNKLTKYAKEKGYDYIKHTTESPDQSILFPETVALNPQESLLTKSQLKQIWDKTVGKSTPQASQLSKGNEALGAFAGFEVDEDGNVNFNPEKATIGLGLTAGFTSPKVRQQAMKEFKGFKDLTTKTLEKLKGKTSVSKQFISDLSNQPDLKQPERDLIRGVLKEFEDGKVPVDEFANKMKAELLPLKSKNAGVKFEDINLPSNKRENIANYFERIYESPIKTSAGDIHYSAKDYPNYFAHTRVQDLADGEIREVIEIQGDLMQKGRLEGSLLKTTEYQTARYKNLFKKYTEELGDPEEAARRASKEIGQEKPELTKLQPYRNIWHERIIKEEVKKAAQDGKKKLRFPTGETAMKIEGITGEALDEINAGNIQQVKDFVKERKIKTLNLGKYGKWDLIGTDQGRMFVFDVEEGMPFMGILEDTFHQRTEVLGKEGVNTTAFYNDMMDHTENIYLPGGAQIKNDPIYKFYESKGDFKKSGVRSFIEKKYNAKKITDEQGVEWFEVDITPEMKNKPIEAFGGATIETIVGGAALSGAALLGAGLANKTMTETINYERPEEKQKKLEGEWKGTNYDPFDVSQNRPNASPDTTGKGASGVEMDDTMVAVPRREDGVTAMLRLGTVIYVPKLDKKFLVADLMNERFNGQKKIDFATKGKKGEFITKFNQNFNDIVILREGGGYQDVREYAPEWKKINKKSTNFGRENNNKTNFGQK